jgi:3-phenylpropionate/trans-cinnamate dioxygenase ferredoxin reductase subunit
LILATGANNRKLVLNGTEAPNILYLRTLNDAQVIAQRLESSQHIAIVGGGFIGLELAALAAEKGKQVTVIEAQTRLMERVLPAVISTTFQQTHEHNGVRICLNSHIEQISSEGIQTKEGFVRADLILAGIGVIPADSLAQEAGIVCENGVAVNEFQQTSVPYIYAIGDCANHYNVFARKNIRLESVQNAVDQAKVAVNHILEQPQAYRAVPWFWTNQYHLKLQMVGISAGFDECVLRGEKGSDKFSVYYFKNKQLIGVDSLNRAADHLNARKLITAGISPTKTQVEDLSFNLNDCLK